MTKAVTTEPRVMSDFRQNCEKTLQKSPFIRTSYSH